MKVSEREQAKASTRRERKEERQHKEVLCAIYARVSTTDQKCDSQLTELREYAKRRGWKVFKEYVDWGFSGRKNNRPALNEFVRDASLHLFQVVIVYKLDRFGRSVVNLTQNLILLKSYGCRFIAVTQGLDTDESNPMSSFMMHILAAVAEFESGIIRERVQSGIENAKKNGTRSGNPLGRPKKVFRRDQVVGLRSQGLSLPEIARELHIGYGTVQRELSKTLSSETGKADTIN